ncbi:MAG: molybdopterin-dependent oxidoreductase [Candidatus Kapabacteria bacterium]|nr:molybdopterin-dependent oxidoreductase [Candidatus Kapabacteria bacterium]
MKNIDNGRRRFALGTALGIGGVVSGVFTATSLFSQIKDFDKEKNAFSIEPNIWLEIREDNKIVITIPRSELGQGVRTSLSMITAEELDADWDLILPVNAVGDSKYGNQSTGGSTSMRVFWDILRTAGAQARMLLLASAAQLWQIPIDKCRTEKSYVYEIDGQRSVPYSELIDIASTLPVPPASSVKLKQPSEFKIIGKTKWHIDNPDIVTGKAIFGSDFRMEGMKYAVVLRPTEIGGSLKSFDDTKAKNIDGYIASYQIPQGLAVVAESTYIALSASDSINAEWNPGPISTKDSRIITQELINTIGNLPSLPLNTSKTVESVYEVPLLAHATMEPMNSFAHYHDDKCDVWTITQNPQNARTRVAGAVGLAQSDVTVNVLLAGGGFGRGHINDFVEMAARISKLSGYPIKLFYTKADCIRNDYYRSMSIHSVKAGIDNSGKITGWIHKVASQGSVNGSNPSFQVPNIQNLSSSRNYSIPTGPWRSVNSSQVVFVNESLMDELAILANADPLEFRLNITTNSRLKRVIELVAEKAEWSKKLPDNWGRGIACNVAYGSFAAHVVEVSVSNLGILKVERVVAALDCGIAINPGNIEAQFVGSAIDGLSTAIKSEITIKNGRIEQSGFHNFQWLTMRESPNIEVHIFPSNESPGGIGELGFPSVSPALCNAIYDACKIRIKRLPIKHTSLHTSHNYDDKIYQSNINIYPNPFEDFVNVEFDISTSQFGKYEFSVFDILGNRVFSRQKEYYHNRINEQLNLSKLISGAYILTIKMDKNILFSNKLIKLSK